MSAPTRRHYDGMFTDTHRWDSFEHRPGDIFICVPPKSGTTWMQNICGLLIFGDPDTDISFPDISPWMEFRYSSRPLDEHLARLKAQPHQRFIKSHSPPDGVPYFEDCTYLIGHRHPLDVHFSMWHHVQNMKFDVADHLYTDDTAANFQLFLDNGIEGEGLDQPSLALIAHHLKTARAMAHLPNVHMFHYATMSQDLPGQMARVADAIGATHPPAVFDTLVQAATFKSMKDNAHRTAPGATGGLYKDPSAFFQSGSSGKWNGKLTPDQIAAYTAKLATLLPPEDISYVETGQR